MGIKGNLNPLYIPFGNTAVAFDDSDPDPVNHTPLRIKSLTISMTDFPTTVYKFRVRISGVLDDGACGIGEAN
jgi:hypothetical protein